MREIKSYCVVLKSGELEDKMIRGISVEGGEGIKKILKNNPPEFIEVKEKVIATNMIAQLVPVYN